MQTILNTALPFFALIFCGYGAGRFRLLSEASVAGVNAFVFYFALPAFIFNLLVTSPLSDIANGPFIAAYLGTGLVVFAAAAVLGRLIFAVRRSEAALQGSAAALGNTGYMGLPLVAAALGHRERAFYRRLPRHRTRLARRGRGSRAPDLLGSPQRGRAARLGGGPRQHGIHGHPARGRRLRRQGGDPAGARPHLGGHGPDPADHRPRRSPEGARRRVVPASEIGGARDGPQPDHRRDLRGRARLGYGHRPPHPHRELHRPPRPRRRTLRSLRPRRDPHRLPDLDGSNRGLLHDLLQAPDPPRRDLVRHHPHLRRRPLVGDRRHPRRRPPRRRQRLYRRQTVRYLRGAGLQRHPRLHHHLRPHRLGPPHRPPPRLTPA